VITLEKHSDLIYYYTLHWLDQSHNSTINVSFCTIIYTFVSLHDSDHEGAVRIFVALSCEL